jgi:hypothetical protein
LVLEVEERVAFDGHLKHCSECASFKDFRKGLRFSIENVPAQRLPSELDNKVRLICHAELRRKSSGVPWMIWAALAVLLLLTIDFLIPRIEKFWQDQKITLETSLVLVLLLQNSLMLFFAPVIMRGKPVSQESLRNQG